MSSGFDLQDALGRFTAQCEVEESAPLEISLHMNDLVMDFPMLIMKKVTQSHCNTVDHNFHLDEIARNVESAVVSMPGH